jgi:hypothetical protein
MRQTDAHGAALWLRDEFLQTTNGHPQEEDRQKRDPAEGRSRTHPERTPESRTSVEQASERFAFTEREQWFVEIVAHAMAFALVQRFKALADV